MSGQVPLDELVFDDPVDFPRDRVQVLCVDRVQCPFPDLQHTPADRIHAAVGGEVAGLGEVLALDVERADLAAVRHPCDQERDQDVGQPTEFAPSADQVVLLTAVAAARHLAPATGKFAQVKCC
jgi:hypothetical protein